MNRSPDSFMVMRAGQKIRRRRLELGWSLQKVAEAIGVTRNAVYLWETSEEIEITIANLISLSEALQLPLVELLPPQSEAQLTTRDSEEILVIETFRELDRANKELGIRLLAALRAGPPPKSSP